MSAFFAKIHFPALFAGLTTIIGIVSLPEVAALLPAHAALTVAAVGAVAQAVTKSIQSKGQAPTP